MVTPNKKRSFPETIEHYKRLRQLVYQFLESQYSQLGVKASHITHADAVKADAWSMNWQTPDRRPTWLWVEKFKVYNSTRGVKRFDIALSSYGKLCALCYGVPSRKKIYLKLHLLSRDPQENPLRGRIFEVILAAATTYGGLIGSNELWLVQPLNEGVESHYMKFGFKVSYSKTHAVKYLYRSI